MSINRKTGLLLLLLLFPFRISAAQTVNAGSGSPPDSKRAANDSYAKEPYVFELIENRVQFEADGKGQRDLKMRARIQSESAVHEFGLLVYPYASGFESLEVVSVRVQKPDGTSVETPPSDVQELDSAVSREAPMYTDEREKHIAVKSLATGDVLEAHLRWTTHDPIAPGHFWFNHSYFRAGICLKEILQIDVPTNVTVKFRNSDPQPSLREEGGRRVYTFTSSNLKKEEESKIPQWEKDFHGASPPDIEVSSFSSWEDVGNWFGSLEQAKTVVTPEIRTKAEELIKGKSSEDERLRAIYSFVSARFRYIGVDLGLGRYTPHAASEVLVNRYGDCKDKHTLFAALLQAAGIKAYPALISSKYRVDPSFPTISLFDHVITAIPQGEAFLFLDTTPEVAPYGLLMQNIRDRKALVIPGSATARIITTPADPPFLNFEHVQIDASIDVSGTLDAKMRFEDRGDSELVLRLAYRATPQNRWQELTQRFVGRLGFGGTVSDVSVAVPEDTTHPFWITCSYHRTDYPEWKEHRVTLPAPFVFLASLNEEQKLSKDALPLGALQDITYETSMKFPEGYSAFVSEKKVEKKSDFAEFTATFSFDQGVLRGVFHLKTLLRQIPGTERAQYSDLTKKIDETARRYILISDNSSASAPTTPPTGSPLEGRTGTPELSSHLSGNTPEEPKVSPAKPLYEAGQRAMRSGNYAASAQLYELAVAQDPNYKEAWNNLGYVYGQLRQYGKEEAALRKALALDPAARWAHYNLGNALMEQKKYEEAVTEYRKEIQSKSNNSLVYLNLGRVFLLTDRFAEAIPQLETAATRLPDNPAVQFNLGLAYAKTGQPEKAGRAFNRSVELEPTSGRKNSVAYEMAVNKLELDRAQKYVESAIEHTVDQMKDVSLDHVSNEDVQLPSALGAYWDTLGWVKFQQGNVAGAEKYVRTGWLVRSIGEIGDHLGQIYEKEGRKTEAIQMYAMALTTSQPMPDTKTRLAALLGSEVDIARLTEEARSNLAKSRTIQMRNASNAEGIAEFWVLLQPGPKVSAAKFISGDEALRPFANEFAAASFPDSFPDSTDVKLLRRGRLTCLRSSAPCTFQLMSAETVRSAN